METTNNRMELLGAINALEGLKAMATSGQQIIVFMDSKYVVKGMNDWVSRWQLQGWRTADKKPVKNKDLWLRLLAASKDYKVLWQWVKGHSDLEENEEADRIARNELEKYRLNK